MSIYIVDSRRKWQPQNDVLLFDNFNDFISSGSSDVNSRDIVLLHMSDMIGVLSNTPESIGDGSSTILFYTGGGQEDAIQPFRRKFNDEDTGGGRFKQHKTILIYDLEPIPEDPYESILWQHSIEPYLIGKRDSLVILTPNLIQYGLAFQLLCKAFFSAQSNQSQKSDIPSPHSTNADKATGEIMPAIRSKDFWEPLFTNQKAHQDFIQYDPYGWKIQTEKVKALYDCDSPNWDELRYIDFQNIIESIQ